MKNFLSEITLICEYQLNMPFLEFHRICSEYSTIWLKTTFSKDIKEISVYFSEISENFQRNSENFQRKDFSKFVANF